MKTTSAFLAVATAITSLFLANRSTAANESQDQTAIRPFHFTASKEALADLKRRIAATRWPEKETVTDSSQGVQCGHCRL